MSAKTKISWCDSTASPWYGCTKVSPGCKNCYAEGWAHRAGRDVWGKGKARQRSKSFEAQCRKWNAQLEKANEGLLAMDRERRRIFPSLCDWLDEEVPIEWLAWFLDIVRECPTLDFLLLTKRPEQFEKRFTEIIDRQLDGFSGGYADAWLNGLVPENVWIGVSVEDQKRADERIPELLKIPAKVRFFSVEPLLERVNLDFWYNDDEGKFEPYPVSRNPTNKLTWVIVGGESGAYRRDCGVDAIVDVAQQCQSAGVPVWVKQDCALRSEQQGRLPDDVWNLKQLP